jgi:hypothetical protein
MEADNSKTEYNGSCQCGQVAFKVTLPVPLDSPQTRLTDCSCSICTRNRYHLIYVPRSSVTWIRGWDKLKDFRFSKKVVDHKFCPDCGSSVVLDMCSFYKEMEQFREEFRDAPDLLGLNVSFYLMV